MAVAMRQYFPAFSISVTSHARFTLSCSSPRPSRLRSSVSTRFALRFCAGVCVQPPARCAVCNSFALCHFLWGAARLWLLHALQPLSCTRPSNHASSLCSPPSRSLSSLLPSSLLPLCLPHTILLFALRSAYRLCPRHFGSRSAASRAVAHAIAWFAVGARAAASWHFSLFRFRFHTALCLPARPRLASHVLRCVVLSPSPSSTLFPLLPLLCSALPLRSIASAFAVGSVVLSQRSFTVISSDCQSGCSASHVFCSLDPPPSRFTAVPPPASDLIRSDPLRRARLSGV